MDQHSVVTSARTVINMTHSQESRVSSSQDTFRLTEEISSVSVLVNRLNSCLAVSSDVFDENERAEKMAASSNQEEKKTENTFPWMPGFADLCRGSVGSKSIKELEYLLTVYLRNVSVNVKDCYLKPNRAAKLKKCMNDALVFFHIFYQDIREPVEHSVYLDRMTELVSMYLDMEIKASRRRKESLKKVACRLTSSLYIFLDHSEDHILESILRAKLINKHYRDICNPLLGKLLSQVRSPLHELLYVRYLLVYKVWKRVVGDAEDRKRINKVAIQKLAPPPCFLEKVNVFSNVLPKIPKSRKNITLFYMQAKFNLKNACVAFLKTCKESQQSNFSQNLSVNMDNSLFFSERLSDTTPRLSNKIDDMDGGGSSKLINDIWSSICNVDSGLADNSQLKDISAKISKPLQPTGKKKNKEKKNKKVLEPKAKELSAVKGKKKKKKGKKKVAMDMGDTVLAIGSVTSGDVSLLKKACKVKKKKKKKAQMALEVQALCTVIKNESICTLEDPSPTPTPTPICPPSDPPSAMSLPIPVSAPTAVAAPAMVQTPTAIMSPVMVQVPAAISTQTMLQTHTEVRNPVVAAPQMAVSAPALVPTSVVAEVRLVDIKVEANVESEAQAMPIISVGNTDTAISENSVASRSQVMVNQVNSVAEEPITSDGDKEKGRENEVASINRMQPAPAIGASCVPSRVIVLASAASTNSAPKCKVSTQTASENEALAAASGGALLRPERDPVLVPGQSTCAPETVAYVCDSSIKNEVPLAEEPVGDDFNSVPMEIDSDVEILADLRPHVQGPGETETEIELIGDSEIIRRSSHMDNIFATDNVDVVYEMLGGGLQVHSMELDGSPQGGEDGGEPESPEIETFDMYERLSLADMMNTFMRFKGDYSQYGGKRRDCLYRDPMLNPGRNSYKGTTTEQPFMEDDEDREDSDDERESCYELNSSHNSYVHSKRPHIRGAKVGFNGAISSNGYASVSMNEKEVTDGSPSSSSVESENPLEQSLQSNSSYLTSRSNMYSTPSSLDTPSHPRVGLKTPAPSNVRTPVASTPKRISDVNMMRYYTSPLDQVHNESVETRVESTTVAEKERRGLSPDSPEGGFPDVVLDAHKASGQREKETSKRGMLPVSNNSRGKLFRPYMEGLYRNNIPSSIPYPTMSAQPAMGQYCTCSQCYANHLLFLSKYNPAPAVPPRYGVPVQYRNAAITTDAEKLKKSAEKLKSEDEELLRRIEESLSETKLKPEIDLEDSESESKYKPEFDTSLPLKKRLKTLVHISESKVKAENKVKSEIVDSSKSESFPSYPTRPMISIAELEINKGLLTKQIPRTLKPTTGNSQRFVQYNNENAYYQAPIQGPEIIGKVQSNLVPQYRPYTSDVANLPAVEEPRRELPQFGGSAVMDNSQNEKLQTEYQQVQNDIYCSKESNDRVEDTTVNHSTASSSVTEYSGRQFKTPAQLKEIPVTDQYYGAPMLIRPALSMTPSQVDASVAAYVTVPREDDSSSQFNKVHVLDLSVDYPNSSKSTKSQRKKKSSSGSDGRTRTSKRSRSVIQSVETVDDFMRSFEKKRRRKHVTR